MNNELIDQLFEEAKKGFDNAYAPYSKFHVGAAILMRDGKFVTGGNIENISFGATNCAERTAVFRAVAMGYKREDFVSIGIYGDTDAPISPCGICRQVLSEFLNLDADVYLFSRSKDVKIMKLEELLPYSFNDFN